MSSNNGGQALATLTKSMEQVGKVLADSHYKDLWATFVKATRSASDQLARTEVTIGHLARERDEAQTEAETLRQMMCQLGQKVWNVQWSGFGVCESLKGFQARPTLMFRSQPVNHGPLVMDSFKSFPSTMIRVECFKHHTTLWLKGAESYLSGSYFSETGGAGSSQSGRR